MNKRFLMKISAAVLLCLLSVGCIYSITTAKIAQTEFEEWRGQHLWITTGIRTRTEILENRFGLLEDAMCNAEPECEHDCDCDRDRNEAPDVILPAESEATSSATDTLPHYTSGETEIGTAGSTEAADSADLNNSRYILREYEGRIGVFSIFDAEGDKEQLIRILNVATVTLPSADRDALKEGIYADSWEELTTLIDSFS